MGKRKEMNAKRVIMRMELMMTNKMWFLQEMIVLKERVIMKGVWGRRSGM